MLDFVDDASTREKCLTSVSQLPAFIDPKQIPSKKQPFSAILSHPFVHTVEAILPEDMYNNIRASLESKLEKPRCARVFMYPHDLLEHEFFNTYIKTGNILMISEGRPGSDTVFTLQEGIFKVELGREIFERTGLSGKPIRSGGRKHGKERFLVEINLRLPSMLHGKKEFERIVSALKNTLNVSMAWLFCDLESLPGQSDETKLIQKHHPQQLDCSPLQTNYGPVQMPPLTGLLSKIVPESDLQESAGAISEWIAMVQLGSPRVSPDDDVDSYLCRYSLPRTDETKVSNLVSLKWHGLVPGLWTTHLLSILLAQTTKCKASSPWFIISAAALDKQVFEGKDGFTVAVAPGVWTNEQNDTAGPNASRSSRYDALCWEYVGAATTGP